MNWVIIIFFIISIVLYIISNYYVLQKKVIDEQVEHFENEENITSIEKLNKRDVNIKYLNKEDAINVFKKTDQYLQNMNQPNLNARNCQTLSDLYDKYMSGLSDITNEEQNNVNNFIIELLEKVERYDIAFARYISYWLKRISFAKGKQWLESGMPHTLGNVIIMDDHWFQKPRDTTLVHELTHIHQRNFFYEYEDLYFLLGYFYYPKLIKGLEPYYQLNRNNPDGSSVFWLWHNPNSPINPTQKQSLDIKKNIKAKGIIPNNTNNNDYWWIGAVFRSANPVSVTDVNYIGLELTRSSDGIFYYFNKPPIPLNKLDIYNKYMGIVDNNYHPNETSAKYMELYYLDKINHSDKNIYYEYQGYNVFKNYMDDLIQKYYNK
jgi:hypothetical protein